MSRIGLKHIDIPAGVTLEVGEKVITVKGPKALLMSLLRMVSFLI